MIDRSWTFEGPDPPELGLPSDLRERDPMGACDMGWVGPLRPLVRRFCPPGGTVLDPFLGSGSTLIAAERQGRVCFGVELEPKYCDVIVRRWEETTGLKAVLANG